MPALTTKPEGTKRLFIREILTVGMMVMMMIIMLTMIMMMIMMMIVQYNRIDDNNSRQCSCY